MNERFVRTVEVPLDDGGAETVLVQIVGVDESLVRVGRGDRSLARAKRSFGQMLDTVRPVAENFVGRFKDMADAPDEIALEFGISLSAEADVVIASTTTEANFSVSLKWKNV
ncbi:CU044_2847 family protein [Nocardiopsis terrae]